MRDLDVDTFREAETASVDECEASLESRFGQLSEDEANVVFGKNSGKGLAVLDFDVTENAPLRGDA